MLLRVKSPRNILGTPGGKQQKFVHNFKRFFKGEVEKHSKSTGKKTMLSSLCMLVAFRSSQVSLLSYTIGKIDTGAGIYS